MAGESEAVARAHLRAAVASLVAALAALGEPIEGGQGPAPGPAAEGPREAPGGRQPRRAPGTVECPGCHKTVRPERGGGFGGGRGEAFCGFCGKEIKDEDGA